MSEKQEKKVVGRTVAIALGIICIILAVGLVGAVANYTSIISGKDNTIASKDSEISFKNFQIASLNTQITDKDNTISSLQSQVADLTDITNLDKSKVWVNHHEISHEAGYYTYWTFSASYAGYVTVDIHDDNTTTTYVRAIYSAYGVKYDDQIHVVAGGKAVFPILPSSGIEIRIGNTNLLIGATETVTITYYY
jgi:uncharacterized coiled-coil protein SlyX